MILGEGEGDGGWGEQEGLNFAVQLETVVAPFFLFLGFRGCTGSSVLLRHRHMLSQ